MAKKTFWVGMLVLLLVFGMTVTSCDNGTTGGGGGNGGGNGGYPSIFSLVPFSSENPSNSILTEFGFTNLAEFNSIRNANTVGAFIGWTDDLATFDRLDLAWSGQHYFSFWAIVAAVEGIFGTFDEGSYDGVLFAHGGSSPHYFSVLFWPSNRVEYGILFPAGTVMFWLDGMGAW